jgi:hypothetical protein
MARHFTAVLQVDARTSGAVILVPAEVVERFHARGRVKVKGTLNGFPFRGALVPADGGHLLGVNRKMRAGAAARPGEPVSVVLRLDPEPRHVGAPPDLAAALKKSRAAQRAWDRLAPANRRAHLKAIEDAKRPETRARRVAATVLALTAARAARPARRRPAGAGLQPAPIPLTPRRPIR